MVSPRTIAVIGAGPAGLMAAEVLSKAGCKVTVYDRMASPARKFLMAGRGGLNLTHSEGLETLLTRYGGKTPLLRSAIIAFPPDDLIAWVEGLGQDTFVGSSGRVFPKAMKASPLLRAWLRRLNEQGVAFQMGQRWAGWSDDGALKFESIDGTSRTVKTDAAVLACGGASWPRLGSDGQWVPVMRATGIDVQELTPSNAGILIPWSDVMRRFAGQPLKRIAVTVGDITKRGEAMITASGLEGGVVYALSPEIRAALKAGGTAQIRIDLRPDDMPSQLQEALSVPRGKKSQATFIKKAAVMTAAAVALLREPALNLPPTPEGLTALIKSVPLTVTGFSGLERAISSAGGVPFAALDQHFMLKARPGTFAAGEMLDWDAPTGGYLLQASFATGASAARGVLAWLEHIT